MKIFLFVLLFSAGGAGAQERHQPAGVLFLEAMMAHDEMGLPLLKMAAERAQNPDVREIAAWMAIQQENEIPALRALREANPNGQAAGALPVIAAPDVVVLAGKDRAAFDRHFLELAIRYQEEGIDLLEWARENVSNDGIGTMVRTIYDRKKVEIAEMKALQDRVGE